MTYGRWWRTDAAGRWQCRFQTRSRSVKNAAVLNSQGCRIACVPRSLSAGVFQRSETNTIHPPAAYFAPLPDVAGLSGRGYAGRFTTPCSAEKASRVNYVYSPTQTVGKRRHLTSLRSRVKRRTTRRV